MITALRQLSNRDRNSVLFEHGAEYAAIDSFCDDLRLDGNRPAICPSLPRHAAVFSTINSKAVGRDHFAGRGRSDWMAIAHTRSSNDSKREVHDERS